MPLLESGVMQRSLQGEGESPVRSGSLRREGRASARTRSVEILEGGGDVRASGTSYQGITHGKNALQLGFGRLHSTGYSGRLHGNKVQGK